MKQVTEYFTKHKLLILGFILTALSTYAAYYGIVDHQFLHWDDRRYLHKNIHIQSLNFDNIYWMFTDYYLGNWHPATWLSFALDLKLWGYNPFAFKLTNVTIHIFNSGLVYFVTYRMLIAVQQNYHTDNATIFSRVTVQELSIASMVTALFFAIHPQHVESVSWISERKDVLCSLFVLATILSYLKYKESNNRSWLTSSILLYFFALMSKPMAVTIPLVLVLIDIYPLNVTKFSKSYIEKLKVLATNKFGFFILAVAVSMITILTQRDGIQTFWELPLDSRIINACMSIILYVCKLFWPVGLSPFYPFHPWSTEPNIFSLIPVCFILFVVGVCIILARQKIYFPIVTLIYVVVTLLPVIGLIKVGSQAAADRYTYIPLLTLFIVSAAGVSILINLFWRSNTGKFSIASSALALFATLLILTYNLNNVWKDDETLWHEVINRYPGLAGRAYNNLALYYISIGDFSKAKIAYRNNLALEPDNYEGIKNFGKIYKQFGNEKLALFYFRELVRIYPNLPAGYTLIGDYFYGVNNLQKAKVYYDKAFQIAPGTISTLQRKALSDLLNNDLKSAKDKLNYLLKLAPNDIGALQLAAKIYLADNDIKTSQQFAEKILAIKPDDSFSKEVINEIKSRNPENGY